MLNVTEPVKDFHKRVPDMAHKVLGLRTSYENSIEHRPKQMNQIRVGVTECGKLALELTSHPCM